MNPIYRLLNVGFLTIGIVASIGCSSQSPSEMSSELVSVSGTTHQLNQTIHRKSISERWEMQLLDASGRFCRQWVMLPGERHLSAQIAGFSPGFYTISIFNGQGRSAVPLYIGVQP